MKDYFHFKQFSISQRHSSMKVGTDAVLLGAWVDVANARSIIDIGTGTGVIALMLAQRTNGKAAIDAIEINSEAATDARENFLASPWRTCLQLFNEPLQHFTARHTYDLLVSNPPYFINSLKPPAPSRQTARHAGHLTFTDLIEAALKYLQQPSGRLAVILPEAEGRIFKQKAFDKGLYLARACTFRTRQHKPVKRVLMEFSFESSGLLMEEIALYDCGQQWSAAYKELTKEFYLKV